MTEHPYNAIREAAASTRLDHGDAETVVVERCPACGGADVTGPAPERIIYGPDPLAEVARLTEALARIRGAAQYEQEYGNGGTTMAWIVELANAALDGEGA